MSLTKKTYLLALTLFFLRSLDSTTFAAPTPVTVGPPHPNPTAATQPDFNISLRGYTPVDRFKGLVEISGETDSAAPQLSTLLDWSGCPIISTYAVYDWNWANNTRAAPISAPYDVTLIGVSSTPGQTVKVPTSGYRISGDYQALVLYASDHSLTLKYTLDDDVTVGYTVHIDNINVDADLLVSYQSLDAAGRDQLPALLGGQAVGTAAGSEVRVAIRDTGQFMDPRSRKDWWAGSVVPATCVSAITPAPTPSVTPPPPVNGFSCQEKLPRLRKEVECYEGPQSSGSQVNLSTLLTILNDAKSLVAKVADIDVASRALVGDVSVCDTNGRGCTDKNISQSGGAFDIFKVPTGKGYQNLSADGKASPIRFTIEAGSPVAGIPFPLLTALNLLYGIPLTGSGTLPADRFSPNLHNCSIVYTGSGTYPQIPTPKLSCTYIIAEPELKMRYFGSIQTALFNNNFTKAEPGVQCKLDVPGGSVCGTQGQVLPTPTVTPPPTFQGSCNICNFSRASNTLKNLLNEVGNAVKTPASVLAGMLNFEGYEPSSPYHHIFNDPDSLITQISTPGGVDPYCTTSSAGAEGPCQFMPSQWSAYGGSINNYGYSHTPNPCNLRDCLYAAATKLRADAARLGTACGYDNTIAPPDGSCQWNGPNTAKGAYHYYGACTDNYVATVVNYYYNYTCQE